ncbi:hypothetical protein NM208_g8040 [Fusarium decemcellulare]|uniref:Uncharacterized protein n=1 Tax=Fusarium decemcellulare TaxID=57161 RepID=A0ACC1S6X7_9HYPO|nr:hypothetical protein NM208_g8040 [Fusarium decemcellulare]
MQSPTHPAAETPGRNSLLDLELIRRRSLSEQETDILNAFNHAIHPATSETSKEAAQWLDESCPPLAQEEEASDYLWNVWDIMLEVARSPGVTSEIHVRLISVAEDIRLCAKGEFNVWGEPATCVERLAIPTYDPALYDEEVTPEKAEIWQNINNFGARCLKAGVSGPYAQAMDALGAALEEEQTDMTESKLKIAYPWIAHGSRALVWWARDNIGYRDVPVEDTANYVEGGPLYHGPQTMCLRRWGFWLDRFEHFGKEESGLSEEARRIALEAARTMRAVEASIGSTLLSR